MMKQLQSFREKQNKQYEQLCQLQRSRQYHKSQVPEGFEPFTFVQTIRGEQYRITILKPIQDTITLYLAEYLTYKLLGEENKIKCMMLSQGKITPYEQEKLNHLKNITIEESQDGRWYIKEMKERI